ncbi:MAG: PfkB family carbohydrate kinase [Thermoplasmatota archaeon]
MPPILVVGTVALDEIETPFGKQADVVGGSATYFAAAASFFAPVRIVGVVGSDFPLPTLDFLKGRGVDLAGLEVVPGGKTFRWSGRYHFDLNQRDTLATHLNVLSAFDPKLPPSWRDSKAVFLGNIDPELQLRVLDQLHGPEIVYCDTMNFWIDGKRDALLQVLKRVDGLVVNDAEARQLAGTPNLVKAARILREMGPRSVMIKKGEHGALLFDGDGIFSAPAYPLELVFDPTGAGDTFAGGFMGSFVSEAAPNLRAPARGIARRGVIQGSALASYCVEKFGVERLRGLTHAEIQHRYAAFRRLAEF